MKTIRITFHTGEVEVEHEVNEVTESHGTLHIVRHHAAGCSYDMEDVEKYEEVPQLPNYRIYDRTGGGVRHDIYAPDLDTVIEMGRSWIEDGDWSERGNPPGTKIELPCCVREIVRVPDLRSIEALPGVYDVQNIHGNTIKVTCAASAEAQLRKIIPGEKDTATVFDEDGDAIFMCFLPNIPQMIDDHETDHGQSWDCTGTYIEP